MVKKNNVHTSIKCSKIPESIRFLKKCPHLRNVWMFIKMLTIFFEKCLHFIEICLQTFINFHLKGS